MKFLNVIRQIFNESNLEKDFPHVRQGTDYSCGASVVQAILAYYGINRREDVIIQTIGTNHQNGTSPDQIVKGLKQFGVEAKVTTLDIESLKDEVNAGRPAIIDLQAYSPDKPPVDYVHDQDDGHYAVAIGYHDNKFTFEDPSSFNRTYLTVEDLKKRWHDMGVSNRAIVTWTKRNPASTEPVKMD
jgi:predicted double-glycine peptidase